MKKGLPQWQWALIAFVVVIFLGIIDWITGYELNFFVFYFAPVSLAAWFINFGASTCIALLATMVWFRADVLTKGARSTHFYVVWDCMVRMASLLAIGGAMSKVRELLKREHQLVEYLQRTLSEVKVLEAFLPIGCRCKKIRDEDGHWHPLESYITTHSNTQFSHGYCPDCARKALIEAGLREK